MSSEGEEDVGAKEKRTYLPLGICEKCLEL